MVQLFLFKEFKTKYSTIKIVNEPIKAIEICRKEGTYIIPIEEFLRTKKTLEGLSKEERKILKKLKEILKPKN